jgi:Fe-S oxidoreductase
MYYQRYMRPAKDHLVGNIEKMAPLMAKAPGFINFFLRQSWVNTAIHKTIGYIDTPILSQPTLDQRLNGNAAMQFDLVALQQLSPEQLSKKVCIVQDPFTSFYDAQVVESLVTLITKLGYEPVLLPFMPNGKPQHVKGFLKEFAKTAKTSADFLNQLDDLGLLLIGVDPSMVLCYRDEYTKILGDVRGEFKVQLTHEWLSQLELPKVGQGKIQHYALFGHCSEKTALPTSEKQWQQIFEKTGLNLSAVAVGCCGMAGTFGHEASHIEESTGIYDLSWKQAVSQFQPEQIVATGYSCRSQVARFEKFKPKHPLQILAETL